MRTIAAFLCGVVVGMAIMVGIAFIAMIDHKEEETWR